MRKFLAATLVGVHFAHAAASDGNSTLLKPGDSPPTGWSVVMFQVDFGSGGRIKIGNADTCEIVFYAPCHFAVADGSTPILLDEALQYGDTTATLLISGERIYVIKSVLNGGRSMARSAGGLLGALATQPDDTAASGAVATKEAGMLTSVRNGSRFDLELVSASEQGKAVGFVTPASVERPTYSR